MSQKLYVGRTDEMVWCKRHVSPRQRLRLSCFETRQTSVNLEISPSLSEDYPECIREQFKLWKVA